MSQIESSTRLEARLIPTEKKTRGGVTGREGQENFFFGAERRLCVMYLCGNEEVWGS